MNTLIKQGYKNLIPTILILGVIGQFSLAGTAQAVGNSSGLSAASIEALEVMASRKGLTRLDFNENKQMWKLFESNIAVRFLRFISAKNRFHIVAPLEDFVEQLERETFDAANWDGESYHLIRRSYSSLSSLYSYYKLNPHKNVSEQSDFIGRFADVLVRMKHIVTRLEGEIAVSRIYKSLPWFGDQGADIVENSDSVGLKYLDMGKKGLETLNHQLKGIGNTETQIDRAMEFYPTGHKTHFVSTFSESSTKKMVIFLVHGTFAAGSPEYSSDKNILFQQTKFMAQSLANDQNVPVEVYSFGWSGFNHNEARMKAGEELANFVNTYFPPEEYNDYYVGHSHGGNVVLHMATTQREYRTPYLVVTLATPIRKDFITDNLNYLFEFYSESDWVQHYGSYEMTSRNSTTTGSHFQSPRLVLKDDIEKLGLFAHNNRYEQVKIYATKVFRNNKNVGGPLGSHSDLKYMIGALPKVIDNLLNYQPNATFALNVNLDSQTSLSVTQIESLDYQIVRTAYN